MQKLRQLLTDRLTNVRRSCWINIHPSNFYWFVCVINFWGIKSDPKKLFFMKNIAGLSMPFNVVDRFL